MCGLGMCWRYRMAAPAVALTVACVLAGVGGPPAAAADGKVRLGGGAGIAVNGDSPCTLTTIGTDSAGDLGFTPVSA